jgi:hypothetical protein
MDTLDGIGRLAAKAREEEIPSFHVADRVMAQMKSGLTQTMSFTAFDFFAGASAVAALIMLFLAINTWSHIADPLRGLLAPLQEAPLW